MHVQLSAGATSPCYAMPSLVLVTSRRQQFINESLLLKSQHVFIVDPKQKKGNKSVAAFLNELLSDEFKIVWVRTMLKNENMSSRNKNAFVRRKIENENFFVYAFVRSVCGQHEN